MHFTLGKNDLSTEFDFSLFNYQGLLGQGNPRVFGNFDKIGVSLSGGLDSLTLLCLILTELMSRNKLGTIPVTCFCVTKNDGCTNYVPTLLDKVQQKFNCTIALQNNIANEHANVWPAFFRDDTLLNLLAENPNMLMFAGNNIPPPASLIQINGSPAYHDVQSMVPRNPATPFLRLHKPQILDLLYQLGCDDLIPFTHTCIMQAVGTCGTCFSCVEREWGFRELGKIDPSAH